ncbi:MAG: hypothetical protein Q7S33_01920 [Nanoarchaeota archaeon]|nr:hypothetical protein [Nanoarchaeota archaeon]
MEVIAQLNHYLEQMLECVETTDRERYFKLNMAYSGLMDKTFIVINSELERNYDAIRNSIAACLTFPSLKEKELPKVREFLDKNKQ